MNESYISENIELLPEHIIDQIKAGEVLERPASLIKELIENSIDASSTEINIQIVDNGLELISIEDNGKGIDFKNLPYAFLRHATSKLKTFDDLYRLHSFGFRGEALASIAASARVTCQSQPYNLNCEGGKLIINGGVEELLVPMKNTKPGTSIFIKNLFFNTPARLKFIKSKNSEKIQLKKMINSFLVSNPQIHFSVKWDDKEKDVYKKTELKSVIDSTSRISQIFYPRLKSHPAILFGESEYAGHSVKIFLSTEGLKNSPNKQQYLFANQRLFFDKNIHQSLIRHFDFFWKWGDSGHYVVFIETPKDEIDVNVHPNKTQIKFAKPDIIHSLLASATRFAIEKYKNNKEVSINEFNTEKNEEYLSQSFLSKEEQQFQSLEHLKNKNFESISPLPTPIANEKYILNTNDYFIFNFEDKYFLGPKRLFIAHYLHKLINDCQNNEEMISPLLISEPFYFDKKIDPFFEKMKKLGFEFDRLNPEVIVLRTIPKTIHRNLIQLSVNVLFEVLKNHLSHEISILYIQESLKKINWDLNLIEIHFFVKLLETTSSSYLPLCKLIDNRQLEILYNE